MSAGGAYVRASFVTPTVGIMERPAKQSPRYLFLDHFSPRLITKLARDGFVTKVLTFSQAGACEYVKLCWAVDMNDRRIQWAMDMRLARFADRHCSPCATGPGTSARNPAGPS